MGVSDGVLSFWLQPSSHLAIAVICGVNQHMEVLPVSLIYLKDLRYKFIYKQTNLLLGK